MSMTQARCMDDSDLALEMALGKLGGGEDEPVEESSESDRDDDPATPPELAGSENTVMGYLGGFQQTGAGPSKEEIERPPPGKHMPLSLVTLNFIVEDSRRFIVFRRFLKDQCITRNLNFWLACEHYRQLHCGTPEQQDQLYKVADAIYVKFIKHSAPQHVQIRTLTKRNVKGCLDLNSKLPNKRLSPNLFDPAQAEVWEMMEQNELKQFVTSDAVKDCGIFVDDALSLEMAYTPGILPVNRGGSLQQSSSEDSASITSYSTDGGGSELVPRSACMQSMARHSRTTRACISDSEQSKARRHQPSLGPHANKDNPVSRDDFVAMVSERLAAVAKDRETMRKRAQEQARQEGRRSFDEIMDLDWYDLPEASKYARFDLPTSSSRFEPLPLHSDKGTHLGAPSSSSSILYSPYHSPMATPHWDERPTTAHIDTLAQREIQDALKDLEITNQVNRKRRQQSGTTRRTSTTSSLLSYTSDSGVGDSAQWTTGSSLVANRYVHRFVEGQKQLLNQMPKREMDAQAAAIALMNSSPHPEALSHRVLPHSLSNSSGRHRREMNSQSFARNYTAAYSSDDTSSCFTVTSESDLFIPRRYPHSNYSESDEPHQFPRYHRQLSRPRTTRIRHQPTHTAPPIVEQSPTPSSQSRPPSMPAMHQKPASSGVLVVYDLVDTSTPDTKRPPFAKRLPATSHITLAEFKEKIFARRGDYRFFFKSYCEDFEDPIMEEISDDETVLPLYEGKIIGRVEVVS